MDVPVQWVAVLHVAMQRSRLFHPGTLLSLAFSQENRKENVEEAHPLLKA